MSQKLISFAPYRICPIGAHSDHQFGKILGMAIDKGITITYEPTKNGIVELTSANFDARVMFHVNDIPEERQYDWADYLRGATDELGKLYPLKRGIRGHVMGSLPIGGLSSSAAVIIAYLSALCRVNNISLTEAETINVALRAENNYVGVSCGKLDQSCEVYSKKDHLLYLDTKDDSYELIPANPNMKPYEIAIFFSGIERNLAGSKFNMRVDECKSAAYALMAYSGMEYGKFEEARLRNVPREIFEKFQVRKTKKQKRHFRNAVCDYAAALGYSVQVETGSFGFTIATTLVTTLVVFLFGEIIPKSFASDRPQSTSLFAAGLLRFLMRVLTPVTAVFGLISQGFSKLFEKEEAPSFIEDELLDILDTAEEEGVVDEEQSDMLKSAMEFDETRVCDVMTMAKDIESIDIRSTTEEVLDAIRNTGHSRIPVYAGSPDHIVGTLRTRRFLIEHRKRPGVKLRSLLSAP